MNVVASVFHRDIIIDLFGCALLVVMDIDCTGFWLWSAFCFVLDDISLVSRNCARIVWEFALLHRSVAFGFDSIVEIVVFEDGL